MFPRNGNNTIIKVGADVEVLDEGGWWLGKVTAVYMQDEELVYFVKCGRFEEEVSMNVHHW